MYLRIENRDLPVIDAKILWGQNTPGDLSVTVPAALFDWRTCQFKDFELWQNGEILVSGFVFDQPELAYSDDRVLLVNLGCVDDLGRLSRIRAKSNGHYQNAQVTSIVQDLLAVTSNWILGDTSTMVESLARTTIDLRSKELLWGQLVALAEAVPNLFLRYGGYNEILGKHELDIGNFGSETNRFVQGDNITDIRLQKSSKIPYTKIEAYGGKISSRKVTLLDALSYPSILSHADYATYPIQFDPVRSAYVVVDLTPGLQGAEITKSFNINKTKNDGYPTTAEIAEAGFALWRHCVRFLQQNAQSNAYSIPGYAAEAPKVNDLAWVFGTVTEPVYDPVADTNDWVDTFSVAELLRITRVGLNFQSSKHRVDPVSNQALLDNEQYEYAVEVSDNLYADSPDDTLDAYGRLETYDAADDVPALLGMLSQKFVSVSHITTDPADVICAPGSAQEYIFNFTNIAGATNIFYNVLPTATAGVTYRITQVPALPSTPLVLCVQIAGTWPGAANLTLTTQFTFN